MFFLLISSIHCDWWDFNEEEFPKIVANSFTKPLFVLCYSPTCPHCHGLPELLKNFSQNEGNRKDIYYTSIDCSISTHCNYYFHISGTPHLVVVMGSQSKYWLPVPGRNISTWSPFVEKILQINMQEILSEKELLTFKQEQTFGGTTFYLETPSTSTSYFKIISRLSRRFQLYNDSFIYSVNPSLNSFKFTAYISPDCGITMNNNENIESFIQKYKFGYLHKYDSQEMLDLISQEKTVLLINDRPLASSQIFAFSTLQSHFCQKIRYGWASSSNEPQVLKITSHVSWDLPFLFGSDMKNGCEWMYKGKISDAFKNGFLQKVANGKCEEKNNLFANFFNLVEKFNLPNDRNWIMFISGFLLFFVALFTSFKCINASSTPKNVKYE